MPSVRQRRLLRVRRERRIGLGAADEFQRHVERLVVLGFGRDVGLRAALLVAFGLEVAAQRGFALGLDRRPRLYLLRNVLEHVDVRRNALGLDRTARRREIARRGQPQGTVAGTERDDGLHRALAERTGAHQGRPPVILQRAGDDLGGRGRAAVDQDDDRLALGEIARLCTETLGLLGVAAAGRDDLAAFEEGIGHRDRLVEQAARIVAQVDHVALYLVAAELVADVCDRLLQAIGGLLVELGD